MLKKQVMTGIHETVLRFQNYCSINLKKNNPKNRLWPSKYGHIRYTCM